MREFKKAYSNKHFFSSIFELEGLGDKATKYIVKDMQAGDVLTEENLRSIRPGLGVPPKYYEKLLGKKVKNNLNRGTAVSWDDIE